MNEKKRALFLRVLGIVFGAAVYAVGVALFLQPNEMVSGGVGGLSVILDRLTGIASGTWMLLLNVPLILIALWKFGFAFFSFTLLAVGSSSVFVNLFLPFGALTQDVFLAAFSGGALVALGLGIVFRLRATTGGTDIVARLLKLRWPHVKTGVLILVLDACVIVLSVLVFGAFDLALYSALGVLVQALLFDAVLYGGREATLVYLVCRNPEEMTRVFLTQLGVGVTAIRATGTYTGDERVVLLCAMHKKVLVQAKEIVRRLDPQAFLIVTGASQIFGQGFLKNEKEEL